MRRARITPQQHELLLRAFREKPGVVNHAAKVAKVHHRTAKRAWEQGWEKPSWARCIKEILAQEAITARKTLYDEERASAEQAARRRDETERARLDAALERANEARGVRASMRNALNTLAACAQFHKAEIALAKKAADDLLKDVKAGNVKWKEAMSFLAKLAKLKTDGVSQLTSGAELLRLHTGDPQRILGLAAVETTSKVDGEAAAEALGEDTLKKAITDLLNSQMSPEVDRFLQWQAEYGASHEVH